MTTDGKPSPVAGTLPIGTRFAGYEIEGVAGRGGMGVVYRAHQVRPSRTVALKVISPRLASETGFRDRFARESEIAASIEHSNVIPVYEVGEESDRLFIAMRYVEGTDLGKVIATEGRLPPRRAIQILAELTAALDAAHARGLVHRDVKPANVLLALEGGREHVYLTDFGLAKLAESDGRTRAGTFLGTLDYAAPEQLEDRPVDARTDVYAAGCLLYHMLTGEVPFPREGEPATMWAHLSDQPPSARAHVPSLPAELDAVIARAMAKDPDDRYPSAGDLARDAAAAAEGQRATARERTIATGAAAPPAGGAAGRFDQTVAMTAPGRGGGLSGRVVALAAGAVLVVAAAVGAATGAFSGGNANRPSGPQSARTSSVLAPPPTRQYSNPKLGVSFSYPASWQALTLAGAVADFGINNATAAGETRCALLIDRGSAPGTSQEAQFAYVRQRSASAASTYKHYTLRAIQAEQGVNIKGVGLIRVADGRGGHLVYFFRGRDMYLFDCITPAATLDKVDQQDFRPLLASVRVG
jgi:predicted Ser/Thr protein kinase